jgi:hypothetical protein
MIVTCPECMGRLSTAAPQCPHCGFVPQFPGSPPGASARGGSVALGARIDAAPPSEEHVRFATRRVFAEWRRSSRSKIAIGALLLVAALAVLVGLFLLANRLNARSSRHGPRNDAVVAAEKMEQRF